MASVINVATTQTVITSNDGAIVEITLSNGNGTGGAAVGPFIVTAVYEGASTQYVWSEVVPSLTVTTPVKFDLSIDNESYLESKLHIGIGFTHTTP